MLIVGSNVLLLQTVVLLNLDILVERTKRSCIHNGLDYNALKRNSLTGLINCDSVLLVLAIACVKRAKF